MKEYFSKNRMLAFLKVFVAAILFTTIKDMKEINTFNSLVVVMLEFIIVLEIVRMVIGFLFHDDNNIQLRFMIDSTIVFFIRDIMLIANAKFDFYKIGSILIIIGVLFFFRILTIKYSPSVTNK